MNSWQCCLLIDNLLEQANNERFFVDGIVLECLFADNGKQEKQIANHKLDMIIGIGPRVTLVTQHIYN